LKKYSPTLWNVHNNDNIINRTNNPLERYNRRINKVFPVAHPNILSFLETIKKESNEYVSMFNLIKSGRMSSPKHLPVTYATIPADYYSFPSNIGNGNLKK
jgi:hypothetical protein